MKFMRRLFAIVIVTALIFSLTGCGSAERLFEDSIFKEKINAFFDALENDDADKIKSLFSKTAINENPDIDEKIAELIAIYPDGQTKVIDQPYSSLYEDNYGKSKSEVANIIPIVIAEEYYWVHMSLVYEDDFNPDNVGFEYVYFYTADEYCILNEQVNRIHPGKTGLLIFNEQELDQEVRCINSLPYAFTSYERELYLADIDKFLKTNTNWEDFVAEFGEPNAQSHIVCKYYEVIAVNSSYYLRIIIDERDIISASLYDTFNYADTILEEK